MPNSCVRSNSAVSRTRSPGSAGAEAVSGRLDTWARLLQAIMRLYSKSEEHTSELQSLMRISYAVFCLKKKKDTHRSDTLRHAIISTLNTPEHHITNITQQQ